MASDIRKDRLYESVQLNSRAFPLANCASLYESASALSPNNWCAENSRTTPSVPLKCCKCAELVLQKCVKALVRVPWNELHAWLLPPPPPPPPLFSTFSVLLSIVLVFSPSSVLVSFLTLHHLSWCPFWPSIMCPGVPFDHLSSVLVPPLCSLSAVLMSPLFYHLLWYTNCSFIRSGVPSVLSSVLASYHQSWCSH